jgi:cytochrome c biogenesis protein CcmG, thiol:disulfide interchange protein DsbE
MVKTKSRPFCRSRVERGTIVPLVFGVFTSLFTPTSTAYDVGDRVKPTTLAGTNGEISLPSAQKRWQYVDFWASWCAPCKQSFPWMNSVRESFAKRGVDIVAVNVDAKRGDADRFLKQVEARIPLAFDASGVAPKAFAVKAMPSAYLIDPEGRVRWVHRGFRDGDGAKIESEIFKIVSTP